MSPLLIKISKDFATLWTTIDPIGNVALFAGLTAALTRSERHRTALRAVIYATVILVAAGTVGQVILDAIGIHMHSLKVAGGIIETRSLPTLTRSYPSSLYLDHSHCPVLVPATLAALPSTRAIPNRDVFYVAEPSAPFPRARRVLCR